MTRVQVYRNLRTGTWSVRDKKTRRVVDHPRRIFLRDCKMFVSQKGNARVRAEKCKNVHAWVEGDIFVPSCDMTDMGEMFVVRYNPYQYTQFMIDTMDGETELYAADFVRLDVDSKCPVTAFIQDQS